MASNWENFLKNLGEWRGSFTKISADGEILDSTPSILNLEADDHNQVVLFRLRRFNSGNYDSPPIQDYQQEYRSLGRQNIFFATGAFSKGTLQLAPFSEFGAEYGFVDHDRRLRLVQLYDQKGNFISLTLIREFRSFTDAYERPQLTVEQLIGNWQGQAHTVYADLRPSETYATYLEIKKIGDGYARQILLLPDGSSSDVPLQLQLRKSFFVAAGWLVRENERQRLIRNYSDKGGWISSTHIIEHK